VTCVWALLPPTVFSFDLETRDLRRTSSRRNPYLFEFPSFRAMTPLFESSSEPFSFGASVESRRGSRGRREKRTEKLGGSAKERR
jgi:hypothetical protein